MILIKTKQQIKAMTEGGKKLAWVMSRLLKEVKPSLALYQLDRLAQQLIEKQGGKPSFNMVPGYKWTTCLNVNQGVVHGIPNQYRLKEGDILSVDVGMFYKGMHTDMAWTLCAQSQRSKLKCQNLEEKEKFLQIGKIALKNAIEAAKAGNRVGHISQAIEKEIKKAGFSPIEALTGHGVGKKLHEDPQIPCFLRGKIQQTPKLKTGMTLAIEVIYSQGSPEVVIKNDGWTIETADGGLAALFEKTILITSQKAKVLT